MTQTIYNIIHQESFNKGLINIRKVTLAIKTFREQHLFTSHVIEFKGTKILERLFYIRN